MSEPRDWPGVEVVRGVISDEVDYWREELTAPWREGREGRAASVGRWIGLGLAVAALAAGLAAAVRSERPWE